MTPPHVTLADIAPRLARARDQLREEYRHKRLRRRKLVDEIHQVEKLVAHRELQYVRAARANPKYVAERARKLKEAERILKGKRREWREVAA